MPVNVEIPEPNEYAKSHGHNPFPPRWERWLSAARLAILSAQPQAGRHVSTDEHPGKGTVINIDDSSARRPAGGGGGGPPTGACCIGEDCSITTEADCISAGGTYQGNGTVCDPNPCGICPRNDPVCVTFAGITDPCGCVPIAVGPPWVRVTDISLNGTFVLPKTVDIPGTLVQWEGYGGDYHIAQYSNNSCTTLVEECNITAYIILQCNDGLNHNLHYGTDYFDVCVSGWDNIPLQLFRYTITENIIFGIPEDSELSGCGLTSGTGRVMANGGTATISLC